jgi:hypothetical protein
MIDLTRPRYVSILAAILWMVIFHGHCLAGETAMDGMIYNPGQLKPWTAC